jgi:hypothetical protein
MNKKVNVTLIAAFTMILGGWHNASASISSDGSNSLPAMMHRPVLIAALDCQEWKKRNGDKGKEAATDTPSWVKNEGHRPCKNPNEDGKAFAKRLLDEKYSAGNYKTGAGSEYSQIQKYGDRSFE